MSDVDPEQHEPSFAVKAGARIWIGGHNREARRFVEHGLREIDTSRPPEGPVDVAFITPKSADEAAYFLSKLSLRLKLDGQTHFIFRASGAMDQSNAHAIDVEALIASLREGGWSTIGNSVVHGGFRCLTATRSANDRMTQ